MLALLLAGLAGGPQACHDPAAPGLEESFELRIGHSARVDGALDVRFDDVVQDSRCPTGVTCIWAGDAVVRLHLGFGGDSATTDLHTNAGAGVQHAVFAGYDVALEALAPAPAKDQPVARESYTATLRVRQR